MNVFVKICWAITALAAVAALLLFKLYMGAAQSAPQEGAGAAIAVAVVVIPYVFTRAMEGLALTKPKAAPTQASAALDLPSA